MLAAERRISGRPADAAAPAIVARPDGLARRTICALSGLRAGNACLSRTTEWLPHDSDLPICSWHHETDEGPVVVWPAVYREWAGVRDPAPPRATIAAAERPPESRREAVGLSIVSPGEGSVYLIDPTLRPEFQTLALRASGAADASAIRWSVDQRSMGSASAGNPLMWPLTPGRHRIEARDNRGNVALTTITVK
jgi:hypothetical protein